MAGSWHRVSTCALSWTCIFIRFSDGACPVCRPLSPVVPSVILETQAHPRAVWTGFTRHRIYRASATLEFLTLLCTDDEFGSPAGWPRGRGRGRGHPAMAHPPRPGRGWRGAGCPWSTACMWGGRRAQGGNILEGAGEGGQARRSFCVPASGPPAHLSASAPSTACRALQPLTSTDTPAPRSRL